MNGAMARTRALRLLVMATLLLVLAGLDDIRVLPGDAALGTDYNDFYVAATAQRHGQNAYSQDVLTRILQETFGKSSFSNTVASPPAFFAAFRPFTALPPRPGYLLWIALSCMVLALGMRSLGRLLGLSPPWLWALALSPPTVIAVFLGQISLLLVACYIWAIDVLLRGRPRAAGLLLALTLVKPHLMLVPAALLCALCWQRGGRTAALSALVASLAVCALAVPLAEPGSTAHWLGALFTYGGTFDRWQPDLSSLAGIYLPWVSRPVGRALSIVAVLAGIACAAWIVRDFLQQRDAPGSPLWWRRLGLGIAVWLLVLPYVHPYDDTLLILPVAVLIAEARGSTLQSWALVGFLLLLGAPQMDLMGFRPNLTFSYTSIAVLAVVLALLERPAGHLCADTQARP